MAFGPFNRGGNNLQSMMKQAQAMQEQMHAAKEALKDEQFKGTAGGGLVEAVASGERRLLSVKIDPGVVDADDVETLEDLVIAAVNNALEEVVKAARERLGDLADV